MKDEFEMSLFAAPISPVKDSLTGWVSRPVAIYPSREVTLQEVARLTTGDPTFERLTRQLRPPPGTSDKEWFNELKRQTLPYITPCGTFSYRKGDRLLAPSGLVVVDIDGLDSAAEAGTLRKQLFDDTHLCPALCFISPSERGVKTFVPCPEHPGNETPAYISEHILGVMNYVEYVYGDGEARGSQRVDPGGKGVVHSCFLCHDPNTLFRT